MLDIRALIILAVTLNLIVSNDAAKILAIFPTPSISHQVVFRPLTQELARRGHEVTVITTDPAFPKGKTPSNLTEIDVHDLSYKPWKKFVEAASEKKLGLIEQMEVAFDLLGTILEKQLKTDEVQRIIHGDNNYDLIFVEAIIKPALGFSHIFKAPAILVSSFGPIYGDINAVGAGQHSLIYSLPVRQKLNELSVFDKMNELRNHYAIADVWKQFEESNHVMMKRVFGEDTPSVNVLLDNVAMLFLNNYPIWDSNRPVPPSVVYMGGLHQKPVQELPKELKSYLDSSKNGVIYISFGTNVAPSLLPPEKIQVLIRVFSKLPYDVLWKYDKDELPGKSSNIRISNWFPQSDLLRHPKVKLFITQGGLQSTDEAITAGVPLVGFPMLGDQWYNVEKYVQLGIGLRQDLETVTEDSFRNAIETILRNDSYRQNIKRLGTLMKDEPQPALDRAIWWTEHVLRHKGGSHLRSPAANMSAAEYYQVDLLLFLLACAVGAILVSVVALKLVWSLIKVYVLGNVKVKLN